MIVRSGLVVNCSARSERRPLHRLPLSLCPSSEPFFGFPPFPMAETKNLRKNNLVELALRFAPDLAAND